MHSHIWGKSDVICYWCILEFKSSLIQTKVELKGVRSDRRIATVPSVKASFPTPLSQRSHERQKSTYPKFDLTDTPHSARTRHFVTIFTNACHWNHHNPDEFSPTYSNNMIVRIILIFFFQSGSSYFKRSIYFWIKFLKRLWWQSTGWHKKTGNFEKPNKNWRNEEKKILTEIEPLQLAF